MRQSREHWCDILKQLESDILSTNGIPNTELEKVFAQVIRLQKAIEARCEKPTGASPLRDDVSTAEDLLASNQEESTPRHDNSATSTGVGRGISSPSDPSSHQEHGEQTPSGPHEDSPTHPGSPSTVESNVHPPDDPEDPSRHSELGEQTPPPISAAMKELYRRLDKYRNDIESYAKLPLERQLAFDWSQDDLRIVHVLYDRQTGSEPLLLTLALRSLAIQLESWTEGRFGGVGGIREFMKQQLKVNKEHFQIVEHRIATGRRVLSIERALECTGITFALAFVWSSVRKLRHNEIEDLASGLRSHWVFQFAKEHQQRFDRCADIYQGILCMPISSTKSSLSTGKVDGRKRQASSQEEGAIHKRARLGSIANTRAEDLHFQTGPFPVSIGPRDDGVAHPGERTTSRALQPSPNQLPDSNLERNEWAVARLGTIPSLDREQAQQTTHSSYLADNFAGGVPTQNNDEHQANEPISMPTCDQDVTLAGSNVGGSADQEGYVFQQSHASGATNNEDAWQNNYVNLEATWGTFMSDMSGLFSQDLFPPEQDHVI